MDKQTIILVCVFGYFAIGATIATLLTVVSYGFGGKFDPMVIVLFFFWGFIWLFKSPPAMTIIIAIAAASGMTWLAYALMNQ